MYQSLSLRYMAPPVFGGVKMLEDKVFTTIVMAFHFVYVLQSLKDNGFYVGFTENLEKRKIEHDEGKNKSTASRRPLQLIFYEAYLNKYDALRRERYLKSAKGKTVLKSMLREHLSAQGN